MRKTCTAPCANDVQNVAKIKTCASANFAQKISPFRENPTLKRVKLYAFNAPLNPKTMKIFNFKPNRGY